MHKSMRSFALAGAIIMASAVADALDLPVKNINGQRYYYYEVKHGDTVYSLAGNLGVSRDEIIRYNPAAADGLRSGATLYFPYDIFAAADSKTISHEVKRGETLFGLAHRYGVTPNDIVALNPHTQNGLKSGETVLIPISDDADGATQPAHAPNETPLYEEKPIATPALADSMTVAPAPSMIDSVAEEDEYGIIEREQVREASIAVILPFGLGEETMHKQAQLYTDFYKGMLLAADTLRSRGQCVSIHVYDSSNFVMDDNVRNASVVIAPEDNAQMSAIVSEATKNGAYVLNVFNLKDETYLNSSSLIQANIPHSAMYAKAYGGMRERFGEMRPVILRNNNGRNEKSTFTDFIRDKYIAEGIAPVEIGYNGTLRSSDLDILEPTEEYLVIPSSGTLGEFNKMSHALKAFREDSTTAAIDIFGYPDWTAFRNDALDMLHSLEATIYTRVFFDPEGDVYRSISDEFVKNYGVAPMEVVPNQGALGYDVATMIIENLRNNGGEFVPDGTLWRGKQSAFRFERTSENGGYVNNALFIVTFGKDNKNTQCIVQ